MVHDLDRCGVVWCGLVWSGVQFDSAGRADGIQAWQVVGHRVKPWPQPMSGIFYSQECFIVLHTVQHSSISFSHDVRCTHLLTCLLCGTPWCAGMSLFVVASPPPIPPDGRDTTPR